MHGTDMIGHEPEWLASQWQILAL